MSRIIAAAFITALALGACNTISGIGEDLSAGGAVIQDAAERSNPNSVQRQKSAVINIY